MFNCVHCNREFKNKGVLSNHEPYCKLNPNRIKRKISKLAGYKKGCIPWCKGLTKETDDRIKNSSELLKLTISKKDKPIGKYLDLKQEEDRKLRISQTMKKKSYLRWIS